MSKRPRLLDLFSGAGGAAFGYFKAGFDVVGVDIKNQPHYPAFHAAEYAKHFEFHQADALTYPLEGFDAYHASPPCQAFTALRTMPNAKKHADLLTPMRERLKVLPIPGVIENVPGAPMKDAYIILCGSMFGLGTGPAELRRHRLFELYGFFALTPSCAHYSRPLVCGVYGGHGRDRRRSVTVTGHAGGRSVRDGTQQFNTDQRREAMGIDWMNGDELSQAIPPAYTEYIGIRLLREING